MNSARHVIGCHLTQGTRVQNAFDDVASTIHQSLADGAIVVSGIKEEETQTYDEMLRLLVRR